jgi:hypothetical protein
MLVACPASVIHVTTFCCYVMASSHCSIHKYLVSVVCTTAHDLHRREAECEACRGLLCHLTIKVAACSLYAQFEVVLSALHVVIEHNMHIVKAIGKRSGSFS